MTGTLSIVKNLKENDQDFEWYPTTDEMIGEVSKKCGKIDSMLDVGAGDGRVLEMIDKLNFYKQDMSCRDEKKEWFSTVDKFAIEKSTIHIENMPAKISIVGTDFMMQTLIDKKVDMVFCNPPYSEFEVWAVKVIKQANAKQIFLILPYRWNNSGLIADAIKQRSATVESFWGGDFINAERQARACVEIVKIKLPCNDNYYGEEQQDPFNVWFDEYFAGFGEVKHIEDENDEEEPKDPLKEIAPGKNLVEHLYSFYVRDMSNLLDNYKSLSELDAVLLKELGIKIKEVKDALKQKIEGLKNKYWQELFSNLDEIKSRLTSTSQNGILEKMRASCNVDFSVENAYAVVIWIIKNANEYMDDQLVSIFRELTEPNCVKNYKSNLKTWEKNEWRYLRKDHTHYTLDYRIVTERHAAIKPSGEYCYGNYKKNLATNAHTFINDIFVIASNLDFKVDPWNYSYSREWESNQQQEFKCVELGKTDKVLTQIRAFKNGNIHFKFDQNFIKALNIEASRLLGWIKTPEEASKEMGIDIDFVKTRFKSNLTFSAADGLKLLTA